MPESYVLFHIGPVQGWIEQARRTQDLFAGSRLLSMLAYSGLKRAHELDARIVIPAIDGEPTPDANSPNRFMIACDTAFVKEIADKVRNAITAEWQNRAEAVKTYLNTDLPDPDRAQAGIAFNDDIWKRQIDHFLEVFYVFTPKTDDYKQDNARINALMNARKQMRSPYYPGEPGEKCSITGEHEALHPLESGEATREEVRAFWAEVRRRHPNKAEFSEGERLCAISTVKRLIHETSSEFSLDRFPSTSSIAAAPFRVAIIQQWHLPEVKAAVGAYLTSLQVLMESVGGNWQTLYFTRKGQLNRERMPYIEALVRDKGLDWNADNKLLLRLMSFDGDWLFDDTLAPRTAQAYAGAPRSVITSDALTRALTDARERLQALIKVVGSRPSPYYAILHMDGDDMGLRAQEFDNEEPHRDLSQALLKFVEATIRPVIEGSTPGRLVYSGGDDVLALVPAFAALKTANEVAQRFEEKISGSMSAGIAIVHRTHNLRDALEAARKAERTAKETPGKNAFCIEFLRRSGEARSASMRWDENGNVSEVFDRLVTNMRDGHVSRQLATGMHDLIYALVPVFTQEDERRPEIVVELPPDIRKAEFERIFARRIDPKNPRIKDLHALRDDLIRIAEYPSYGQGWLAVKTLLEFARFLSQMEVIDVAVD